MFVEGLLDRGWLVNHKYLGNYNDSDDVDFRKLMLGRRGVDYHLISPCGNYTVRITKLQAKFWQMLPKWKGLATMPIANSTFTDSGIRCGIVEIVLDRIENSTQQL